MGIGRRLAFGSAIRLLEQIDQEELHSEQKLLEHQQEIASEILLRRQGRIATKDAQIPLALASLRHAEGARLIAERIDLSEEDGEQRFQMMRSQRDEFCVRGSDEGLNADLLVSIEIARINMDRARGSGQRGVAANDLGVSLQALGECESGTARLDEAVAAFREALKERTRECVPLDWAMTQNNLGNALQTLGSRESGTARLDEAVAAYREALKEYTRERVPLQWAGTQNNLGNAVRTLGERESGTAGLDAAVAACREALKEWTREAAPHWHDIAQQNLAKCLALLEQRRKM